QFERYIAYWRRGPAAPWRIAAYVEVGSPATTVGPLPATSTTPPVLSATGRAASLVTEVREADSLFADLAYRMGTGYAFSNTVAPDGAVFAGSALVVGPDAV